MQHTSRSVGSTGTGRSGQRALAVVVANGSPAEADAVFPAQEDYIKVAVVVGTLVRVKIFCWKSASALARPPRVGAISRETKS